MQDSKLQISNPKDSGLEAVPKVALVAAPGVSLMFTLSLLLVLAAHHLNAPHARLEVVKTQGEPPWKKRPQSINPKSATANGP
jgi:hypothetical protein